MTVYVFANPKGGTGKSTACLLMGCELARRGYRVTLLDADPNQALVGWASTAGLEIQPDIQVERATDEDRIIDQIETSRADHTLVDLEGTASKLAAFALSRADRVVIPMQGSTLDAQHAARTVALVRQQEKAFRISIPARVLLNRTSAAVRPRTLNDVVASMERHGIPRFETELLERDVFRRVFSEPNPLDGPNPKMETARRNVAALVEEALAWA